MLKELQDRLKDQNLMAMAECLETRNQQAIRENLSHLQFLEALIEDERAYRDSRAYERRLKKSHLKPIKTIESYDFDFQEGLNKKEIADLACCQFIMDKRNIVFMGNQGTGKSHLANAIGLKAVMRGYSVLSFHMNELVDRLVMTKGEQSFYTLKKSLMKVTLLIIDDIGLKAVPQEGVADFYDIIENRDETASTIITTNRSFKDWVEIFGDKVMTSAIIDRILHRSSIVKVLGQSYRIKHYKTKDSQSDNIGA